MSLQNEVPLDEAFNLGMKCLRENNTIAASTIFKDILKSAPDHYQSAYYLGIASYLSNDIAAAANAFRLALDIDDSDGECWCNWAACMAMNGQTDKAFEAWDKAIKLAPDFANSYANKGNALWELKKYDEAEILVRKAIELDPQHIDAWLNLGNILIAQDKTEEAFAAWRKTIEIDPNYAKGYNNMGNAMYETGDLKGAEENCRRALELMPNYPHALLNLGNALRDLGKLKESEEYYKQAIALDPSYAQAHNNLCVCLCDQSRFEEAIVCARYATSFQADYEEALINLAFALRSIGNMPEAEKAAQKALLISPESIGALAELSAVLFLLDRYADAEDLIQKAQALDPDSARLQIRMAHILDRALRTDEALEAAQKAIDLAPDMPDAHFAKAQILHLSNKLDEAIETLDKAMELWPDMPHPYITMSEILQSKGENKEAEKYIRKAQKLNEDIPAIYVALGNMKKYKKDDKDFNKLIEIQKSLSGKHDVEISPINFALFKAYDDIGEYKKSFQHLKAGNDGRKKTVPFDKKIQTNIYRNIKTICTPKYIQTFKGKGYKSDVPVFIIGMPRSGTSLTENIISAHPDAFGAGELQLINLLERKIKITPETAHEMGELYIKDLKAYDKSGKAKRITDKMPANFMRLSHITNILPDAKIIHCVRDPVDTCLSCYKQIFARGQYWSYDFEDLAHEYLLYNDLMNHWREILGDRFIDIQYEETVSNFETQAKKIIDYIDLPWNDLCLEPHKQKRDVLTASKTQVTQPIYQTSVRAWKRYEKELEPLIKALNYDKENFVLK